jgi:hypothetical protein
MLNPRRERFISMSTKRGTTKQTKPRRKIDAPMLPAPHVGRPVKNCQCICCEEHRRLDREAARDRVLNLAFKDAAMGNLQVSDTATDALREALFGPGGDDVVNTRGL